MKYRNLINSIFSLLLVVCSFTACIDDDFSIDDCNSGSSPEGFDNGYSLNVKITLDDMGGTRADNYYTPDELKRWEDYIDPEKIRILFFDELDQFLFESKSRWVKQLKGNQWLISVPIFTYGNDVYEDENGKKLEWNWKLIREALTTGSFKIAILANRPEMEWYPSFSDLTLPAQWMDNTGPHWTPKDTQKKSVFDLHHCQYDALYHAKSTSGNFYDFIMGDYYNDNGYDNYKPQMGATSSWLDWSGTNEREWKYTSSGQEKSYINYLRPDQAHPIPMYGIQRFEKINEKDWQEGTPFNLSDNIPGVNDDVDGNYKGHRKSIWLLRSVVKLELLIPKSEKVEFVAISYPNPYARCEPMDVWTPTDELWNKQHDDNNAGCEISSILEYGTIVKAGDPASGSSECKKVYQPRIGWLYGAWRDINPATGKRWWFNEDKDGDMEDKKKQVTYPDFGLYPNTNYPRIFNPCIQRNTSILCENSKVTDLYDDDYDHYVVYTGERNVNDPSTLYEMGSVKGGKPTVQYWTVQTKDAYYAFPITDYTIAGNPAFNIPTQEKITAPNGANIKLTHNYTNGDTPYASAGYQQEIMATTNPDYLPLPLIRNHVYTLKLTPKNDIKSTNIWDFTKELSAETINNIKLDNKWSNTSPYTFNSTIADDQLTANSFYIKETEGIKFTTTSSGRIQLDGNKIRLGKDLKITFLNVSGDCVITFKGKAAGTSDARGVKNTTTSKVSFIGIGDGSVNGSYSSNTHTFSTTETISKWKVTSTSPTDVTFQIVNNNIDFTEFSVEYINNKKNSRQKANGNNNSGFIIKSENNYTKTIKVD